MTIKKNVIFDATILSTLQGCEALTNFRFNLHLQPKESKAVALEKGLLIHKILEVYYKSKIAGLDILQARREAIIAGEKYVTEEIRTTDGEIIQHIFAVMGMYFTYYQNEFWIPIEVEKVRNEIIYEDDEVRVLWKSKLDLLVDTNQNIMPVDHKSFSRDKETLSLNNQFMGQCVVTKSNNIVIDKIGLHKIGGKSEVPLNKRFTRPVLSYSNERLDEWKQEVGYWAKYWIGLTEIQYYPKRYTYCDKFWPGCAFKGVCGGNQSMREEELNRFFEIGEPWSPDGDDD